MLGNVMEEARILPGDFVIPYDNAYREPPPSNLRIELRDLQLTPPGALGESVQSTRAPVHPMKSFSVVNDWPEMNTYQAHVSFTVSDDDTGEVNEYTYSLCNDVYFVTAHPCAPSQHVRMLQAPFSPTIRQVDLSGSSISATAASATTGHPLHKYFTYISIHLSELLAKQSSSFEELLANSSSSAHKPSLTPTPTPASAARVLVIDCITGFQSLPQEHEIPLSPVVSRSSTHSCSRTADNGASPRPRPLYHARSTSSVTAGEAGKMMHTETRRRHFGSDMEILVRAICAEKGWNALISRRRRGCLACAIREAGALGWKVVIRVD